VDKYTWVDIGSSYLLSDILAAILYAQLEKYQMIQSRRKQIWDYYYTNLITWSEKNCVRLPIVPEHCEQAYHMFYILLPDLSTRQALIQHLRERGIVAVFHYQPLHLSEMGRRFGGKPQDCPVTEKVADQLLRLPFYNTISRQEQDIVIQALYDFRH